MSSPSLYHQSDTRIQSELRIIEKSKKNPNHFAPLYEQYHENIFRYIVKRVDDVEAAYDITSNVFVKALTNLHKYEFRGVPFSSWLFRIAKSELYQSFRDKKARRTVSIDKVIVADIFEEFEESFNDERKAELMQALREINEKDLALIELRYFEKRSYREIGEIINVTENNAKVKTFRALQRLKKVYHK
ncbi:sigma-70 family RNA polymerase sigma factor [Crocinitomicaceae bacterium]|jgi:RNA polymerase sigma-70 factor (ECF subfamily)|nr:sigma-70 family RNA polymerase sigma factor [Crocinitomicaceae bacterium]